METDVALCRRCFGSEPRWTARLERPQGRGRVLVLGERPPAVVLEDGTRLGLGSGDPTSRFLRALVAEAAIPPGEVVVGAAVLCRPRSRELEAAVPSSLCLRRCAVHVRELVRAVGPRLIVPLGASALRSVRSAFPERRELAGMRFPRSVGRTNVAMATFFHPLYHVSARARRTRSAERQREDWRALGKLWSWIAAGESAKAGDPAPFPLDTPPRPMA